MSLSQILPRIAVLALLTAFAACGDNQFPDDPLGADPTPLGGSIRGQVTAAGVGVGDVRIVLAGGDSTLTSADGVYRFTDLIPATYTVQVRVPLGFLLAPGEEPLRRAVVTEDAGATVDWRLVRQ